VLVFRRILSWLDLFPDRFLDFFLDKPFAWLIPFLGPFALLSALRGISILRGWHPWPGFFVLILGAIVAVVPFVVDPPFSKRAKAFWVLGITVLTSLEIISLKLGDDDSKAKFESLLGRFDETLNTMTGGDSWPYIDMVEYPLGGHTPLHVPRLIVRGNHPLRGVQLRVIDFRNEREALAASPQITAANFFANQFAAITQLGDIATGDGGHLLPWLSGIDTGPSGDKRYFVEILALNGSWREDLQYIWRDGKWEHAIRVIELADNKGNTTVKIKGDVDVSSGFGVVDWGE